jgi:hypothetical protein
MVLSNEILKKISDAVYQEAFPPEDRHRPLEWRRSFNFVCLPLKTIKIVTNYNVQYSDWDLNKEHTDSPWQLIKPDIRTNRSIYSLVNEEEMRDTIYCAVTEGKEEGTTRLERSSDHMNVTLIAGQPTPEGNPHFPSGIYGGTCFRSNVRAGEDYLCFEMYLPENQLNDIIECLNQDPNAKLVVGVNLLSFSSEVDDALREWHHPRDLFIEDSSAAPLKWVNTSSIVGARLDSSDEQSKEHDSSDRDDAPVRNASTTQAPIDLSPVTKALGRLTVAFWVLIAVVLYSLIR